MRVVDRPVIKPSRCAAIPFLGQTAEGEKWIDTGSEMEGWDNHVYISATAVRQMMMLLGYPSPMEFEELAKAKQEVEDALLAAHEEIQTMEVRLEAFQTLGAAGFTMTAKES